MRRFSAPDSRRAKIVATLGPGSAAPDTIRLLAETGVDVFRLNFSHGDHATHERSFGFVHDAAGSIGRPLGVLADLQGPKIRVGSFPEGSLTLRFMQDYTLAAGERTDLEDTIPVPHPEILEILEEDDKILLDDGKLQFTVLKPGKTPKVRADVPGKLGDKKGFTVLGKALPVPALTEKDKKDLAMACKLGVDFVALSFVQSREDLLEARKLMNGVGRLVAKIEKPAALDNLHHIIEEADAVMVARGDLGVEFPPEQVPILQRRVVRAARAAGKPVIVATHMLESMVESASPTRAEASDVATAVYQGADAVMLSAETAVGRHPATAVAIMDRIVRAVETDPDYRKSSSGFATHTKDPIVNADVIANAVSEMSELHECDAIFVSTAHFSVISRFSRAKPEKRFIAHSQDKTKLGHMSLFWGVESLSEGGEIGPDELMAALKEQLGDMSGRIVCAFQTMGEKNALLGWRIEIVEI